MEQRDRLARIAGIERGEARFEKIGRLDGRGNGGSAGRGIRDDERLGLVGFDRARKGEVIAGARGREFAEF